MIFLAKRNWMDCSIYSESFGIQSGIVSHFCTKLWFFEEKKAFFHNFYSHPFLAHRLDSLVFHSDPGWIIGANSVQGAIPMSSFR